MNFVWLLLGGGVAYYLYSENQKKQAQGSVNKNLSTSSSLIPVVVSPTIPSYACGASIEKLPTIGFPAAMPGVAVNPPNIRDWAMGIAKGGNSTAIRYAADVLNIQSYAVDNTKMTMDISHSLPRDNAFGNAAKCMYDLANAIDKSAPAPLPGTMYFNSASALPPWVSTSGSIADRYGRSDPRQVRR